MNENYLLTLVKFDGVHLVSIWERKLMVRMITLNGQC